MQSATTAFCASANPGLAGQFPAFSPNKTFAMFNDNQIELSFVQPSAPGTTPIAQGVRGFGAVFLDVETPNTTSVEFFNGSTSLGKFFAPVGGSGQPEFVGALFNDPVVTRVQLTLGNATLFSFNGTTVTPGPADLTLGGASDQVATDDFVYAEPSAATTPSGPLQATVGVAFSGVVASFTDADPNGTVADYSARPSTGETALLGRDHLGSPWRRFRRDRDAYLFLQRDVHGHDRHFRRRGRRVRWHIGTTSAAIINAVPGRIFISAATVKAVEGQSFTGDFATFTDEDPTAPGQRFPRPPSTSATAPRALAARSPRTPTASSTWSALTPSQKKARLRWPSSWSAT